MTTVTVTYGCCASNVAMSIMLIVWRGIRMKSREDEPHTWILKVMAYLMEIENFLLPFGFSWTKYELYAPKVSNYLQTSEIG